MDNFIDIDNFIKDIFNNINDIKMTNNGTHITDKNLTIAIKKALIDVTEKYKENYKEKEKYDLISRCNIYDEKYKNNEPTELLYDIIIHSRKDNYMLDEVFLVGESELGKNWDIILEDFEKLLFARAKVRLMVYQVGNSDEYEENIDGFKDIIEKSSSCIKGDIYLFAVYNKNINEWKFVKYVKGETAS